MARRRSTVRAISEGRSAIVKHGFVQKQGHFIKNWKRRLLVLTTEQLLYYKDDDDADAPPKGIILLNDITSCKALEQADAFSVTTNTGKDYTIIAPNNAARQSWVSAIRQTLLQPSQLSSLLRKTAQLERAGRLSLDQSNALRDLIVKADTDSVTKAEEQLGLVEMSEVPEPDAIPATAVGAAVGPVEVKTDDEDFIERTVHFDTQFELLEKVGDGAYSVVHKCQRRSDGELFAVKIVKKARLKPRDLAGLKDEVQVMRQLRHKNIVSLISVFESENTFYIVTEFMAGGELFDRIVQKTHYTEREAQSVVRTLAEGIAYLHSRNVVHRDLKPENILLSSKDDDAVLKIADMGFARPLAAGGMHTSCGTPSYVAPEILMGQRYGIAVDMWSLGVIMYTLLCGYAPFFHRNQNKLFRIICAGQYSFDPPYWNDVSDDAKDLISRLLVVTPSARLTAAQVLEHPWIQASDLGENQLNGVIQQMRLLVDRKNAVIKRGYLIKQGKIVRSWKRRSFVLTGSALMYFEDESSRFPKGIIPVKDIIKVEPVSEDTFVVETTERDYILQAESAEEMLDWIAIITPTQQRAEALHKADTAMRSQRMTQAATLVELAEEWQAVIDHMSVRRDLMRSATPDQAGRRTPGRGSPRTLRSSSSSPSGRRIVSTSEDDTELEEDLRSRRGEQERGSSSRLLPPPGSDDAPPSPTGTVDSAFTDGTAPMPVPPPQAPPPPSTAPPPAVESVSIRA